MGGSCDVHLVTMRWPARSAITWIIRGDEPAAPTHGGTDHGRAYTHRPGRAQRDHRGGRAATGDGRVRRARDPEHARGAAPAVVSLPGRSGARVKTDRADARNLARLHRAGELVAVRVPTPAEEALRDLVRAREDLKNDRRIARQRIRSFLLRYGKRYPAPGSRWSFRFEVWLRALRFSEPASQAAFEALLGAYFMRDSQLGAVDKQIAELALAEPLAGAVARLRAFRGIDTLTAVTLLTETCDFRRFGSAGSFMAFTGLVPSEHSSGQSRHQGSITKTG